MVDPKYPLGIKAKLVLIDIQSGKPRFLVDNNHNHDSRYFHMHPDLPQDSNAREPLSIQNYEEAKEFFLKEVRKIIINEKSSQ